MGEIGNETLSEIGIGEIVPVLTKVGVIESFVGEIGKCEIGIAKIFNASLMKRSL